MTASREVWQAARSEYEGVIDALVRAFDDDPVVNHFLRQDGRRAEAMRQYFEVFVHHLVGPKGEIWTTSANEGAALWLPPGSWQLGFVEQLRHFPSMVRITGWSGLGRVVRGLDAMEKAHPTYPHWFLQSIGVRPTFQGQGWGRKLLTPILERADAEGLPVYLESSKPSNVPYYERFGFEVVGASVLDDRAPPLIPMRRRPET